jgi:hypothetical protein
MAAVASGSRRRAHSVLVCAHGRHNTAGFWVSRHTSQVARRPWRLSCSQQLDPGHCAVTPFGR